MATKENDLAFLSIVDLRNNSMEWTFWLKAARKRMLPTASQRPVLGTMTIEPDGKPAVRSVVTIASVSPQPRGAMPPASPVSIAGTSTANPEEPGSRPRVQAGRQKVRRKVGGDTFPLTKSQQAVADALIDRAELFFSEAAMPQAGIPIQTNSLLIGPTGSGKTSVVEAAARRLNADFFKVSHGNWIVEGAGENAGTPTLRQVIVTASRAERLVFFVDELDKFFRLTEASAWHSTLLNDLWLVLDRGLSWNTLAEKPELRSLRAEERTPEHLEDVFRRRVFIVAAGTWQDTHRARPRVGFGLSQNEEPHGSLLAQIVKAGGLPEEVLRRFNADALRVAYPSREELATLLAKDTALREACIKVGRIPDVQTLHEQMATMGMTALTSFKTEVLLAARRVGRTR